MQEGIHVSSVVRVQSKIKNNPQTPGICRGEVRSSTDLPTNVIYQISPVKIGFLSYEPGLMVSNSVAKIKDNRVIPVIRVNSTNKTFSIRKVVQL